MFRTLTTKTHQLVKEKTHQQARADRDDLGASKGILLSVLVSATIWAAIGLLLLAAII